MLGVTQFESDADVIRNAADSGCRICALSPVPGRNRRKGLITEIVAAQRILSEDASREKYKRADHRKPVGKNSRRCSACSQHTRV